jgi:hypothetical protein
VTLKLQATSAEVVYVEPDDHDDLDSESSSQASFSSDSDSIDEVVEDLKVNVECLMELGRLFDASLPDVSKKEKDADDGIVKQWTPEAAYTQKIGQRFPSAEPALVSWLGQRNWARYLRCQEMRNKQEATPQEEGLVTSHMAPEAAGTLAGSSKFHDSGLGSSLPSSSFYAETIMSYSGIDGERTRIPRLTDAAKKGEPFTCVACGQSVRIMHNSAWK